MRSMRVLVAEDAPDIRRLLSLLLELEGHHVDTAQDGQGTLGLLEEKGYDAVVPDYRMPHLDGPQVLRQVRSRWLRTRRVLLTAYPSRSLEKDALAVGAPFLTKSVDPADLLQAVAGLPVER